MTPRARMAFWASFLLAAPLSAAEWQPLYTKSQVYFVDKAELAKMVDKAGNATETKALDLVIEVKKADGSTSKEPSEARLNCVKSAPCQIVADGKGKVPGSYSVAPNVTASRQQALLVAAAAQRPAGVSESVWNVIVNSSVDQARWKQAAKALQELADKKPELYGRIAAKGRATYDDILKGLEEAISELPPADPQLAQKLAARVAADAQKLPAVAATPVRPNEVVDPKGAPAEDLSKGEAQKAGSAMSKLHELLEKSDVQADMAARLAAYLTVPEGDQSFIGGEPDKRAALAAELKAAAEKWVKDRAATPAGRVKAALLYYVLGEKEDKDWIKKNPALKELQREMKVRTDFDTLMKDAFSVGGKKTAPPGGKEGGPYKGDKEWPTQALQQAVDFAEQAMRTSHLSNDKLKASIAQNEGPATDLPGPGQRRTGPGGPGDFSGRVFTFEEMYGEVGFKTKDGRPMGPLVAYLPIPGTENVKDCSKNAEGLCTRKISMGVSFEACGGATDYDAPCRKLGIFDISSNKGFGQYFNFGTDGSMTFPLEDRKPGGNQYKLTMSGDQVTFQSIDKSGNPVGRPMTSTVGELYERQHALVQERGMRVTVGDREFLTMDRGGFFTTRQFWPVGADGNIKSCGENPTGCRPEMVAYVAKVAADGTTFFYDKAGIGNVPSAADASKTTPYNLIYDKVTGLYAAKAAEGDDKLVERPKELKDMLDPPKPKPKDSKDPKDKPDTTTDTPTSPKDPPKGGVTDCTVPKLPLKAATEKYRAKGEGSDFDLFTQKSPNTFDEPNGTYICVYGTKVLAIDSTLIGKGDIKISGEMITIKTFNVDSEPGKGSFLMPNLLKDVEARKDGFLYKNGEKWRQIRANAAGGAGVSAGDEYKVPVANLKDALAGDNVLAFINKVATVKLKREFGENAQTDHAPVIVVFYKKGDSYVDKTLKALEAHAKGTICLEKKDVVQAYVKKVLSDKSFTSDIDKVAGDKEAKENSNLTFTCKMPGELADVKPVPVASPSWTGEGLYSKDGVLGLLDGTTGAIIPVQ